MAIEFVEPMVSFLKLRRVGVPVAYKKNMGMLNFINGYSPIKQEFPVINKIGGEKFLIIWESSHCANKRVAGNGVSDVRK